MLSLGSLSDQIAKKLVARASLDSDDVLAILDLPFSSRKLQRSSILVQEGERPDRCHVILSGLTYRQKISSDGARQIVGIDVAGDFACLSMLFLPHSDHDIVALKDLHVADVDLGALQRLALTRPAIGRAMWMEALVATAVVREWTLNIGRRDARSRVSHFLCELAIRLETLNEGAPRYELPMTQDEIGDTVGLTSVHVSRVLKSLTEERLIERDKREVIIKDFAALANVGDFDPSYLFLGQAARSVPN